MAIQEQRLSKDQAQASGRDHELSLVLLLQTRQLSKLGRLGAVNIPLSSETYSERIIQPKALL